MDQTRRQKAGCRKTGWLLDRWLLARALSPSLSLSLSLSAEATWVAVGMHSMASGACLERHNCVANVGKSGSHTGEMTRKPLYIPLHTSIPLHLYTSYTPILYLTLYLYFKRAGTTSGASLPACVLLLELECVFVLDLVCIICARTST
jgi:hypothetical protein